MFFEEKRDVLFLPEPKKPGVKPWPKAHRNAARSGALYTARFWLLVGCEAFAVGMWQGASFTGGLPSASAISIAGALRGTPAERVTEDGPASSAWLEAGGDFPLPRLLG